MKKYIITFDKNAKQIGFTGEKIGVWPTIFYILEYSLIGMTMVLLGFGFYVLWNMRVRHNGKESEKKQKKGKNKGKPIKPEISLTFLEYWYFISFHFMKYKHSHHYRLLKGQSNCLPLNSRPKIMAKFFLYSRSLYLKMYITKQYQIDLEIS